MCNTIFTYIIVGYEGRWFKLIKNTINWLTSDSPIYISIYPDKSYYEASENKTINLGIYVSNSVGGIDTLTNGASIYCLVNGSTSSVTGFSNIGDGVYYYNITLSSGEYNVTVKVTYGGENITRELKVFGTTSSPRVIQISQRKIGSKPSNIDYPDWVQINDLDTSYLIFRFGESMEINATVNNSTDVTIYVTSFPQDYYELTNRPLTYISANMSEIEVNLWSYNITPDDVDAYSAGTYIYFIVSWNSSEQGVNPSTVKVGSFIVLSASPTVDNSQSK